MSPSILNKFDASLINTLHGRKYSINVSGARRKLLFYWGSVGSNINTRGTAFEVSTSPRLIDFGELVKTRIRLDEDKDTSVTHIASGWAHSLIAFKSSESKITKVFSLGLNSFGQLGHGAISDKYFCDGPVEGLPQVYKVVCGFDHTILLTENDNLYSMGWGADGQLGLGNGNTLDRSVPSLIPKFHSSPIRKIASTADFTFALLDNGQLWSWGNSEYGQCMTGKKVNKILEPRRVLVEHKIVDVGAGGSFGAYVTDAGEVYTCGYGALGLGDRTIDSLRPTRIPDLNNIQKIYCAADYTAAISASGELFTWGSGSPSGRLGLGHMKNQFLPMKVMFPQDVIVEQVACGTNHAIALCIER
ncbi:3231_t:CDS:2 [Acaulospora colombiana]|uniref:3231_t:CDS:1 n=1 Tax=Acaulospora colombiana TaxID=27376 RepID=A0ACA9K8E6_9GLOM|nr:3231_t:CDS:2 [Acaulospora colombiana]